MSRKVLIGGGSGFIGNYLSNALKHKGYGTVIVSRMPGPQCISWSELEKSGLPEKVTSVVNLAGQNILDPTRRWTPGFKQNVWTSRVNTTAALAKATNESPEKPTSFISISGVGVYPPSTTAEYTEETPVQEVDFLSHLCHAWEGAALVDNKPTTRTTIIRSGVVLGRSGGMIKQLWLPFFMGVGGPVGDGTQILPWIHIEDMVRLIIYAIENESVSGVLNGVAPQISTNGQFSSAFAKAMWRPCLFPVPVPILNLVFGEERAKIMTQGQKVLPKRTLATGFKYTYPTIEEACQALVSRN